jgi:GH35 family endo-1,4-beta-xylanase
MSFKKYTGDDTELLSRTDELIKEFRKETVVINVVDDSGAAISNAIVSCRQLRHAFLFGCNIYAFNSIGSAEENEIYRNRFAELFNFATLGFYWRGYEREQGKPNYAGTEEVLSWCEQRGIVAKGHPLVWSNEAGIPTWLPNEPDERMKLAKQRVSDIVGRFRNRIDIWDVVNEPIHMRAFSDATSNAYIRAPIETLVGYVDDALRCANEANPEATLIVNEFNIMSKADSADRFYTLMETLKERNAPFRAIGIQAHEPRTDRFPLANVLNTINRFATLGVPIHITEYTPTSDGQPITGYYHSGTWTEAEQAQYAEAFYRACFSHPAVKAITWWDLCDRRSWLKGGGMLRVDLTPKPVYNALKKLIHEEWHTQIEGKTDINGKIKFSAFAGDYEIKVGDTSGWTSTVSITVDEHRTNEICIQLTN